MSNEHTDDVLNQQFEELSQTHKDLQVNYMRLSLDYKQSKSELFIAYKTIAAMRENQNHQESEMRNLEATFSLITDELKNSYEAERKQIVSEYIEQLHQADYENDNLKRELRTAQMHAVELNEILTRERQKTTMLENDIESLTAVIEKIQDSQQSGPVQIQMVPPAWSCLLCYEEKTPTCDAVICPNAQCNKRICRECIGKIESEDDCVQCPYCRLEYKISAAQDRENYKIEIFKLHAKCAELNKIIKQFNEPRAIQPHDIQPHDIALHIDNETKMSDFQPQIILSDNPEIKKILTWYVEALTKYIAQVQNITDQAEPETAEEIRCKWLAFIKNAIIPQSGFPDWIVGIYNAEYASLNKQSQ